MIGMGLRAVLLCWVFAATLATSDAGEASNAGEASDAAEDRADPSDVSRGDVSQSAQAEPAGNRVQTPPQQQRPADAPALAEHPSPSAAPADALDETLASGPASWSPENWTQPGNLGGSLQTVLALSVISLAPAILLMTTCYVRIIVVLTLLRQAIGMQGLPPTQVLTSIALFMTLLVMTPTWTRVYEDAIRPYSEKDGNMTLVEAYRAGALPVREFMSRQIAAADNRADVMLFYRHVAPDADPPRSFADVPIQVLLPAFVISELKVAFLIGFCIFLPFLVVDLVVASVTMSMGMFMLPPAMISLPLKLLLFVLVGGWHLVVGTLLSSFAPVV